ncbi:MAG: [protein-PII] uridylyltransferase [Actinomycetota bacterium]|nr:[protein-PII] uridylyltransferase [Actinomycetota bacterium]
MQSVDAATIKRMRTHLVGDPHLAGRTLARRLSQQADSWLYSLASDLPAGWAVMATGGYARGVLCPGSDIDVMLVHPVKARDADVRDVAQQLWYPMWDGGLKLSPATHNVKTLLALAASDLDTATAVLKVRCLAGDRDMVADLQRQAVEQWRRKPMAWLQRLLDTGQQRWTKLGDVASLLEPDLKDGRGGLRDHDMIRWALAVDRPDVSAAFDGPVDDLAGPADLLLAARCELHRVTGRTSNVLQLQDQDKVAEAMGYADADSLMLQLSGAAHTIEWATERFWRRIERLLHGGRGTSRTGATIGAGVTVIDGEAHIAADAEVDEPSYVFHLAATAAHAGLPVSVQSLQILASRGAEPGEPWSERTRRSFLSLLGAGQGLVSAVEALERYDLFSRYLPEWRHVRSLPQRNAFHTYTVDRHLLQTVANANEFVREVSRPDLLLCGALLHDIGKGHPGDHTEVGMELVVRIADRMGWPPDDIDTLVALVEHHLLIAETATRRDLGDPRTAANVAAAVQNLGRLELLDALTRADSLATGPSAWSAWKARLIDELVDRTSRLLRGDGRAVEPSRDANRFSDLVAAVAEHGDMHLEHVMEGEFEVLRIASADRSGLFSLIAGTLSLHGVDVVGADAHTGPDGTAVDEFRLSRAQGTAVPWQRIEHDLRAALAGQLDIPGRLSQRITARARRRPVAAASPRREVIISNEASDYTTMIDVRAPDGPLVLYRLSNELVASGLDIRSAKVATLGHEVVDVFYVHANDGGKVPDHEHEALRARLKSALSDG